MNILHIYYQECVSVMKEINETFYYFHPNVFSRFIDVLIDITM